jgi:hypothetical protein
MDKVICRDCKEKQKRGRANPELLRGIIGFK